MKTIILSLSLLANTVAAQPFTRDSKQPGKLEDQFRAYLLTNPEFARSFELSSINCQDTACTFNVHAKPGVGPGDVRAFQKAHTQLKKDLSLTIQGSTIYYTMSTARI